MGRKANRKDREVLKRTIENHPHKTKGFLARLLDWHPQKVERELSYLESEGYLLTEDNKRRIAPYDDNDF
jgi:predicted transcriptional regulator